MITEPFVPYTVTALGQTFGIVDPEGVAGYRVSCPSGAIIAVPAASGEPCEANAVADLTAALTGVTLP